MNKIKIFSVCFVCIATIFCLPLKAQETLPVESQFIIDFFKILNSNTTPTKDEEELYFGELLDIKACLKENGMYKNSETPVFDFLKKQRSSVFKTEGALNVGVYTPCKGIRREASENIIPKTENVFVFAMINLDRNSANPPTLLIAFSVKTQGKLTLAATPTFFYSNSSETLYDMAYREKKSKP